MTRFIVALLLAPACALAGSTVEGRWNVIGVEMGENAVERATPGEFPSRVEIQKDEDGLVALYTNRNGATVRCTTVGKVEELEQETVFGCSAPFKRNQPRAPNLRIQLRGSILRGITVTDRVAYRWSAERESK
jgi:hypothetical protein